MELVQRLVLVLVVTFVVFSLWLQVAARRRAAALAGKPLPSLPGPTGARIAAAPRALIYFYTPSCGACRPITPRMKQLAEGGAPVFPIDATVEPELAHALRVMATPTTIEVSEGRTVKVHIGPIPSDTFRRFTPAPA